MFSRRLVPAFRQARCSFSRDVTPWGSWGHWRPPSAFRYRRWGPIMIKPVFGAHHPVNRLLLYNLNRLGETVGSFWFDDWYDEADSTTESKSDQKRNGSTSSYGQEVSQADAGSADIFTVSLNVGDAFKPDEISVKVVGRKLQIEGKHEERGENGHYLNRSFAHSYVLPPDVDDINLTSKLTAEGILKVEAPRLEIADVKNERHIPVEHDLSVGDDTATAASGGDDAATASAGEPSAKDTDAADESDKK